MSEYLCHCTVVVTDYALKTEYTSRPTFVVTARSVETAKDKAAEKLIFEYTTKHTDVRHVLIEKITKIG